MKTIMVISFVYRNYINSWKKEEICSTSTVAPHPSPLNNNDLLYGLLEVFLPDVLRLFSVSSYSSWRYVNPRTAAEAKTSLKK